MVKRPRVPLQESAGIFAQGAAAGGVVIARQVLGIGGVGAARGRFAAAAAEHDEEENRTDQDDKRNEIEVGMHGRI